MTARRPKTQPRNVALDEMRSVRAKAIADYRDTIAGERKGAEERAQRIAEQYVASQRPGHPLHGVPMLVQIMAGMPNSAAVKPMWLFFAQCGDEIKIGFSNDPDAAVVQLARQRLTPVELLMFVAAQRADKARMLSALRGSRKTGEWFTRSAAVLAVLDFVKSNRRLPTPVEMAAKGGSQ